MEFSSHFTGFSATISTTYFSGQTEHISKMVGGVVEKVPCLFDLCFINMTSQNILKVLLGYIQFE